jgi:hypothetical protein
MCVSHPAGSTKRYADTSTLFPSITMSHNSSQSPKFPISRLYYKFVRFSELECNPHLYTGSLKGTSWEVDFDALYVVNSRSCILRIVSLKKLHGLSPRANYSEDSFLVTLKAKEGTEWWP